MAKIRGKVYFVGSGPGDPGLLAVRAAQLLADCQILIHDRLCILPLEGLIKDDCEVILGESLCPDDQIDPVCIAQAIVAAVHKGKRVVRLFPGDPYLAARSGEEILGCRSQGVEFEVVPGVPMAIASPAYAGIPLLQSGLSGNVGILSGPYIAPIADPPQQNRRAEDRRAGVRIRVGQRTTDTKGAVLRIGTGPGKVILDDAKPTVSIPLPPTSLDWKALCAGYDTLVMMRAGKFLQEVRAGLLEAGRSPAEPVAAVSRGTTPLQKTVVTTIWKMDQEIDINLLPEPLVLVVGDVVNLREHLNIFEQKSLFGLRIAMTRPPARASETRRLLEDVGATVLHFPAIDTAPVTGLDEVLGALRDDLRLCTHLVFAGEASVDTFFTALSISKLDARIIPERCKLLAVGERAYELLLERSLQAALVKEPFSEPNLMPFFSVRMFGDRVLLLGTTAAHPSLTKELRLRGANVTEVPIYESQTCKPGLEGLRAALEKKEVDCVTFFSPSAAVAVAECWGKAVTKRLLGSVAVGSVGSQTSIALSQFGVIAPIEARPSTTEGLIDAIARWRSDPKSRRASDK